MLNETRKGVIADLELVKLHLDVGLSSPNSALERVRMRVDELCVEYEALAKEYLESTRSSNSAKKDLLLAIDILQGRIDKMVTVRQVLLSYVISVVLVTTGLSIWRMLA